MLLEAEDEGAESMESVKERIYFSSRSGETLCGILSVPAGRRNPAVVVMCHGFSTGKDGRTYSRMESILNAGGAASFRFDFFGHGESGGKFEDITLTRAVEDTESALGWVRARGFSEVALLGSSFGGLAALCAAGGRDDLLGLALKSPVTRPLELLSARVHGRSPETWKKKGFIEVTGADGRPLRLNVSFLEDALGYGEREAAEGIRVPTMIVHGSRDETVPLGFSRRAAARIPGCRLEVIRGADHTYSNPAHFERMLRLLSAFLLEVCHRP